MSSSHSLNVRSTSTDANSCLLMDSVLYCMDMAYPNELLFYTRPSTFIEHLSSSGVDISL